MECSFCMIHLLSGRRHMTRDPDAVAAEIAALPNDHVYFCDDETFLDPRHADALAGLEAADALAELAHAADDLMAEHERQLRADHRQVDLQVGGEVRQLPDLVGTDRYQVRDFRDPGIAGSGEERIHRWREGKGVNQRVFAGTGAENKDTHGSAPSLEQGQERGLDDVGRRAPTAQIVGRQDPNPV